MCSATRWFVSTRLWFRFRHVLLNNKDRKLSQTFNFSFRYIDNILSLNNTLFGALSEMMGTLLFAYLRWRRRDVCNFHMIYIDDIIHSCMCVIFWTWKWYIESSWIKWNKNEWKQLNIRGSWTKWKSETTNPFLALIVYVNMSEIHETGGVCHKI